MSIGRYTDHEAFMADHGTCQLSASAVYPDEQGFATRTLECDAHGAYEVQTTAQRAN
jgi:hypothetical protein